MAKVNLDDNQIPEGLAKQAQERKRIEDSFSSEDIIKAAVAKAKAEGRAEGGQTTKVEVVNPTAVQKVEIINPPAPPDIPGPPDVQKVSLVESITTKVLNWPAILKISGRVKADVDFPDVQKVAGNVRADVAFPDVQKVQVNNQPTTIQVENLPVGETGKAGPPDKYLPVRLTDGRDFYRGGGSAVMGGGAQGEWPREDITYDANGNATKIIRKRGNQTMTIDITYDASNNPTTVLRSEQ